MRKQGPCSHMISIVEKRDPMDKENRHHKQRMLTNDMLETGGKSPFCNFSCCRMALYWVSRKNPFKELTFELKFELRTGVGP